MLGFRSDPKAACVVPPPGEGCWRKVLGAVRSRGTGTGIERMMQSL